MRNLLLGFVLGMILAGQYVQAGNPCDKVFQQDRVQNQKENLRFKQRLFTERFERGKR